MAQNPIYGPNRLKLGTFCTNGQGGASQTLVPEGNKMDWATSLRVAQQADAAGFEAAVPFARWKPYLDGQPAHPAGNVLDPFSWAAAIAQATSRIGVFVTTHAATLHPLVAARQLATIDIISGGRLAVNVVAGWNRPELEMFGAPLKEHDERYEHLEEWLAIVERLWESEAEFDHHGRFFDIVKGSSMPKPVQRPRPPLMNAGGSERGQAFACEHADMCFVILKSEQPEKIAEDVATYKRIALEEHGRDVQVWINAFVVQKDTQEEADAYLQRFAVEQADIASRDALISRVLGDTHLIPPAAIDAIRLRMTAGAGGYPLVGTGSHIADRLRLLSELGIDGVLLTWVNYDDAIEPFARDVIPLLESFGLRGPAQLALSTG
jgi:FMNH2-dependent dimethyl sulfone monooxygenase